MVNCPSTKAQVLVTIFDDALFGASASLANDLRGAGLNVELYSAKAKLKKQLKFAQRKGLPVVAIMGSDEAEAGRVSLKRMGTGEQVTVAREAAAAQVNAWLDTNEEK